MHNIDIRKALALIPQKSASVTSERCFLIGPETENNNAMNYNMLTYYFWNFQGLHTVEIA